MTETKGARLGVEAARRLAKAGCCEIAPGLSDREFDRVEAEYGFAFSADHRAFLAAGLPVASPYEEGQTWKQPWPDWRDGDPEELRRRLDLPVQEILWDVEAGDWPGPLGPRPGDGVDAMECARQRLAGVPQMVPLYAHRFLPAGSGTSGHPVLSMWGTDIICYGSDLAHYIDCEFGTGEIPRMIPEVTVPFWRDFM
ncbi:hypothetical protein [Streptomyces sp. UNOC14_S4]|uniref:hypothetical protein n=1 Tax=Streptomyces sp. UNOC14_S4 TaxID=2872340 RepID=UPI001E2B2BC9|nr:hypothetical protein [Streptomyces sp. UNOC14_S4]MCC3770543.1 hypothetical protein [Streptomyces sp. UNOC14_S4]